MDHLLKLTPRFRVDPANANARVRRLVSQSRDFIAKRGFVGNPNGIVWTNVDGTISDCLEAIGSKIASREFAWINGLRADGVITKAYQLWLKYHVLLVEKNVGLAELTKGLTKDHQMIGGAYRLKEKLLQHRIATVAITNDVEEVVREALEQHYHFELPVFGNGLWLEEDGAFTGLDLVHGADWIDKGAVVSAVSGNEFKIKTLGCIGNGPSDITMARETARLGGLVLTRGRKSPLTQWCEESLPSDQFVIFTGDQGLGLAGRQLLERFFPKPTDSDI
jgi:hypothetical protein